MKRNNKEYKNDTYEFQDIPSLGFSALAVVLSMVGLVILFAIVLAAMIELIAWL